MTGASGSLGRAISLRLAEAGCDVAALYHRNAESADEVVREIGAVTRANGIAVQVDATDTASVANAIDTVKTAWGRIDVLVCSAGIFSRETIIDTSDDEFALVFAVNVKGVFNFIRATLPVMMAQRGGRIVTISSHNAKMGTGLKSKATYAATKSAVESYTRGAAVEAAPFNINVNCVSPGWIPKTAPPSEPTALQRRVLEDIPLNRTGRAAEVAAAVAFLASDNASYITGETLDVNGGTWMD